MSQSPGLGGQARLLGRNRQAAAPIVLFVFRSGSYTSPLTHNRCSSTANFLATATTARFVAFFPPRCASFNPQRRRSLIGCSNINGYTETCGIDNEAPVNVTDLVLVFDDEDGLASPTKNPDLTCTDNHGGIFTVVPITQSDGTLWWTAPGNGGSLSGNLLYHTMTTSVASGYNVTCRNNSTGSFIDNSIMVLRKADGTAFSGFGSNSTHWTEASSFGGCDISRPCSLEAGGSVYTWSMTASISGELIFWAGNAEGGALPAFAQPLSMDGDGISDGPYFNCRDYSVFGHGIYHGSRRLPL